MKKYLNLCTLFFCSSLSIYAQDAVTKYDFSNSLKEKNINPKIETKSAFIQKLDTIFISPEKTLILAFTNNQKINFLNMDCSQISNEIINEDAAIALKLKTSQKGFSQTNAIINSNGKYYGYVIQLVAKQREIVHFLDPTNSLEKQTSFIIDNPMNKKNGSLDYSKQNINIINLAPDKAQIIYDSISNIILENETRSDGKYTNQTGDCKLSLVSTHVYQDKLYFTVRIANKSSITYDIDFIKFGTKFKKKSKNQAVQETEISPIYEYNSQISSVQSGEIIEKIFVFDKFTIDKNKKKFKVEAWEKNGERPLTVFYPSEKITNAELL